MPTAERWVIVYKDPDRDSRLYVGQQITRIEAIQWHVVKEGAGPFRWNTKLTSTQREAWKKCRARGDRAVKVKIVWEYPE